MNLQQLYYFKTVAELKHICRLPTIFGCTAVLVMLLNLKQSWESACLNVAEVVLL